MFDIKLSRPRAFHTLPISSNLDDRIILKAVITRFITAKLIVCSYRNEQCHPFQHISISSYGIKCVMLFGDN